VKIRPLARCILRRELLMSYSNFIRSVLLLINRVSAQEYSTNSTQAGATEPTMITLNLLFCCSATNTQHQSIRQSTRRAVAHRVTGHFTAAQW